MSLDARHRLRAGLLGALVILCVYGGVALTVDFPKAAVDIQSDEATYLLLGHSIARDFDLEYRREDLLRARAEWRNGPGGIFLKRGTDVTGVHFTWSPPFVVFDGVPDPDPQRLYYGKSFAYPLAAAPFVRVFGTNGFLMLNALLLLVAFLAAYLFISARSGIVISLILASGFIFASVIPVYFVWTTPELFNFSLTVLAYFLWLYKYVAPEPASAMEAWLRRPSTTVVAGAIVGLLTFSKITNGLLILPPIAWLLWTREWRRAALTIAACGVVAATFFGINVASSGEWNYQGGPGGDRVTCYGKFPFDPSAGLEVCSATGRDVGLFAEVFDAKVFWSNLRANVGYFVVGRYGGLIPYFFPGVAAVALFLSARRRESWQWLVLGGVVCLIGVFIVMLPYTYLGDGGSVGNRYFTGIYGLLLFVLPPVRSLALSLAPWVVGAFFMAKLVLNPFQTSIRPFEPAKTGPLRWFPVELTNTNGLPIVNEAHRVRVWYGDTAAKAGGPVEGQWPPPPTFGFQIYHLDDNAYLPEADRVSLWIRGRSRAEMLIKADAFVGDKAPFTRLPPKQLALLMTAGKVATDVEVRLDGRRLYASLAPEQKWTVTLDLPPPFLYNLQQGSEPRLEPALVWVLSISSSDGFLPRTYHRNSPDQRFLGVHVSPFLLR